MVTSTESCWGYHFQLRASEWATACSGEWSHKFASSCAWHLIKGYEVVRVAGWCDVQNSGDRKERITNAIQNPDDAAAHFAKTPQLHWCALFTDMMGCQKDTLSAVETYISKRIFSFRQCSSKNNFVNDLPTQFKREQNGARSLYHAVKFPSLRPV